MVMKASEEAGYVLFIEEDDETIRSINNCYCPNGLVNEPSVSQDMIWCTQQAFPRGRTQIVIEPNNIVEKSDKSIAHEVYDYLVDDKESWKSQAIRRIVPLASNGHRSSLADGLAKWQSQGGGLVADLFQHRSLGSTMVEIAHNTVRKYPDEGFDIASRFVYDTLHGAFDFLQQDAPGHKLSGLWSGSRSIVCLTIILLSYYFPHGCNWPSSA